MASDSQSTNANLAAKRSGASKKFLVIVSCEVALICATILLLFVHLSLPVEIATAAAIPIIFAGSILAWNHFVLAQTILTLSLLFIEFVFLAFFEGYRFVLAGFFIGLDILYVIFLMRM